MKFSVSLFVVSALLVAEMPLAASAQTRLVGSRGAHMEAESAVQPHIISGVSMPGGDSRQDAMTPQDPDSMGGGFIEMVMTGRNPSRFHQRREAAPRERVQALGGNFGREPIYAQPDDPLFDAPVAPRMPRGKRLSTQFQDPDESIDESVEPVERLIDPRFQRQTVEYRGPYKPGMVVIDTPNKFLYLVQPGGTALRYGIGVGRPGFMWAGLKTVSMKREWPEWRPPSEMLKRRPDLPRYMEGGPENPLGARAMYLGSSLYRIHGTNEPNTIGTNVSSGCIRLINEDVIDLYKRVPVGAKVVVL